MLPLYTRVVSAFWQGVSGFWRPVSKYWMWSFCVVVSAPLFDQNLRVFYRVEDFACQNLIAHFAVEALYISTFIRWTCFDIGCLCAEDVGPSSCCKLRPILRADIFLYTAQNEQIGPYINDINRVALGCTWIFNASRECALMMLNIRKARPSFVWWCINS